MNRAQLLHAPVALLPLPRPLMTGEVLDAAFRLYRAGILRCLPYSGLAVLVLQLPALYSTALFPEIFGADVSLPQLRRGAYVLVLLSSAALLGVITLRLMATAQGRRPSFGAELTLAVRRWPMAVIATMGAFCFPVLLMWLGPAFSNSIPVEALFFLAIPAFWPSALFAVTLPAFWCDGLGPFAAIRRALQISLRRSWRMVGALLVSICIVTAFYVSSAMVVGLVLPLFGRADLFLIATISSLVYLVVGAFGVPFVLAMLIVAYEDLKLRHQQRAHVPA
jgi:hypothetical protein